MAIVTEYGNGNGKWRVIVCNGYLPNGKLDRKSWVIEAKSRAAAEKKAMELEVDYKRGEKEKDGYKATFIQLVEKWRELRKEKLSEKTKDSYEIILNEFMIPEFGNWKILQIRALDIEEYLNKLNKDGVRLDGRHGGYSQKTIQNHYMLLNMLLGLAVKWDMSPENQCGKVDRPKVDEKEAEFYEIEQIEKMLQCLDEDTKKLKVFLSKETKRYAVLSEAEVSERKALRTYEDLSHKMYVWISLVSACRRSEVLGLDWEDIDFKNNLIKVCKVSLYTKEKGVYSVPKLKNGKPSKIITMPVEVLEMLKEYKIQQDIIRTIKDDQWVNSDRLFIAVEGSDKEKAGGPMHPDNISQWFERFLKRHNLPKITLHQVRHTSISYLLNNGVDLDTVAERAGHKDSRVTSGIYGHVFSKNKRESADKFSCLFTK